MAFFETPLIQLSEATQIIILAVIQGIAEFLPISSDGHLISAESFMGGIKDKTEINLVLHFGTLLSIVVFYWRRLWQLLSEDRRVIPLLIVGTIPAAVVGLTIKKMFPLFIEDPLLNGFMLPITGFLLLMLPKMKPGEMEYRDITMKTAFLIGIAQSLALLPGISRSGTTIVAGCFLGLRRQSAATFSFLLAVPAISGACVLEAKDIYDQGGLQCSMQWATIGAIISFSVGLLALSLLVKMLNRGSLHWFAYWVIPFGLANVVWQLHLMVQEMNS